MHSPDIQYIYVMIKYDFDKNNSLGGGGGRKDYSFFKLCYSTKVKTHFKILCVITGIQDPWNLLESNYIFNTEMSGTINVHITNFLCEFHNSGRLCFCVYYLAVIENGISRLRMGVGGEEVGMFETQGASLDCNHYRPFWISWKDHTIQLGKSYILMVYWLNKFHRRMNTDVPYFFNG